MNWKERAEALIVTDMDDADYFKGREGREAQHLALVNERLDAEGLRGKVWMVMPYQCTGLDSQRGVVRTGCGRIAYYECEVGVEGPPAWREDMTYVPTAFVAGLCPHCGGKMQHVMHADIEFDEPVEPGTTFSVPGGGVIEQVAEKFFRVPREPVSYATDGCDEDGNVIYSTATHAFLSTPMHAIRRATRTRTLH